MRKLWIMIGLGVVVGCTQPPPTSVKAGAAPEVVVETVSTPSLRGVSYRVRTDFVGKPEVSFALEANGVAVGNFNTDGLNDITSLIRPGNRSRSPSNSSLEKTMMYRRSIGSL